MIDQHLSAHPTHPEPAGPPAPPQSRGNPRFILLRPCSGCGGCRLRSILAAPLEGAAVGRCSCTRDTTSTWPTQASFNPCFIGRCCSTARLRGRV